MSLTGAAEDRLERIETCGTKCSEGLVCRMKPHSLFPRPCQSPPEDFNTLSVFQNISLSTVMRCEGRQRCSLYLRIQSRMQLTDSIHGVSICTTSPGMMEACRVISFTKASRERLSGSQVEVENDCTGISPSQGVQITVKTVPDYCGNNWSGFYSAPGCKNEDFQKHVPECITGRLSYKVNPEKKELSINVTENLEGHNYIIRLCHAKDLICVGTSNRDMRVIKKEDPIKSATLPYSRPLPCLCIEGWCAVTDALRVQVCPFKERVEELWFGITFDPIEASLSWQPACPVTAVITLCQKEEDGNCTDLPQTSHNVSRQKIKFTGVEPHPQLCMKFSAGYQSWIRCPFAKGPVWELAVSREPKGVKLLSGTTGTFAVELCEKSAESSLSCHTTDTVHVEKHTTVGINIPAELFKGSFCLQVKRVDVRYAPTLIHCFEQPKVFLVSRTSFNVTWIIVLAGVVLAASIIVTLVMHVCLTVYQKRIQKREEGPSFPEKQKDCTLDSMVPALQTEGVHHGGVFVPDSPHCRSNEKANLLSN